MTPSSDMNSDTISFRMAASFLCPLVERAGRKSTGGPWPRHPSPATVRGAACTWRREASRTEPGAPLLLDARRPWKGRGVGQLRQGQHLADIPLPIDHPGRIGLHPGVVT